MQNVADKRISIIGCGWLGAALGKCLAETGYAVKGSTTTPSKIAMLKSYGITPFVASLDPTPQGEGWGELMEADSLIVDIPPRSSQKGEEFHPQQVQYLAEMVENSSVSEIIYISSTSVYPDLNRIVTEEDVIRPEQSAAPRLVEAEQRLAKLRAKGRTVAVVRCGGLMGYDRIPGKYVRGKKDLTTGHTPVNYIHRDDVIQVMAALITQGVPDGVFNAVSPGHPPRQQVYDASCELFGWELPTYAEGSRREPFKIVGVDKLIRHLDFKFKYPDPLRFYYSGGEVRA